MAASPKTLLVSLLCLAACASTPKVDVQASPAEMYAAMVTDMRRGDGTASVELDALDRSRLRSAEMVRRAERGELESPDDYFHAGAILVRSSDMDHLLLAESLGRRAVILGDERGNPVTAEALDRQAFMLGEPQLFGTQYAYNAMTGEWQLYAVDEAITDAEREAMGLPPLEWFEARVRRLNESSVNESLRRELGLPPVSR